MLLPNVNENNDWVVVGRFGRPHGIKGFVTVISFTEPRDNILQYTDWHAYFNHSWQPLTKLAVEVNHKFILTQIKGYQEREDVAKLTHVNIWVPKEQLPSLKPGEYYWHQLFGMRVINQEGVELGFVKEIMPTGSNDVLVVVGEKRHLLPYLPGETIIKLDETQRQMTVDWDVDF